MSDYLTENIENYVNYMKQEGLCKNTITQYVSYIIELSKYDSRIYRLTNKDIQKYILSSSSHSSQNCKINAIKKYFKYNTQRENPILEKDDNVNYESAVKCLVDKTYDDDKILEDRIKDQASRLGQIFYKEF